MNLILCLGTSSKNLVQIHFLKFGQGILVMILRTVACSTLSIWLSNAFMTLMAPSPTGKVSAVLGALDGVMPMISFSLYTAVYHSSVAYFPGAQFFFGAGINTLMALVFMWVGQVQFIHGKCIDRTRDWACDSHQAVRYEKNVTLCGHCAMLFYA